MVTGRGEDRQHLFPKGASRQRGLPQKTSPPRSSALVSPSCHGVLLLVIPSKGHTAGSSPLPGMAHHLPAFSSRASFTLQLLLIGDLQGYVQCFWIALGLWVERRLL